MTLLIKKFKHIYNLTLTYPSLKNSTPKTQILEPLYQVCWRVTGKALSLSDLLPIHPKDLPKNESIPAKICF